MQAKFPKTPFLVSIICFVCASAVFTYLYGALKTNTEKLKTNEQAWQTEAARRDEIKTLDSSVKAVAPEMTDLDTHFAESSNVVPFLDTLGKLATSTGSKAEIISVNILEDGSGLAVGLKATGSFESLYKFINLLENSLYELDVTDMNFGKGGGADVAGAVATGSSWSLNLNIKLLSFIN